MSTPPSGWTRREVLRALYASGLAVSAPAWVAACGTGARPPVPPEIAIGQDVCDWCTMTIDDDRLAAAFVPAQGRALRFGEPGCLLAWLAGRPDAKGVSFVAAREDAGWLAATAARFGRGQLRTPMRFDVVAWRGEPAAAGESLTWVQLLKEGMPRAHRS